MIIAADSANIKYPFFFTTWNKGFKEEGRWEWNVTSVIIFGRARLIEDRKTVEDRVLKLAYKYFPTREEADENFTRYIDRTQLFAIDIEHMSGKLVREK